MNDDNTVFLSQKKVAQNGDRTYFDSLSADGKLLYKIDKKLERLAKIQEGTERYTRGIFWFFMAGAIGSVVFSLIALAS